MARVGDVNQVYTTTGQLAFACFERGFKAAGWITKMASDGLTFNGAGEQITHAGTGPGGFGNLKAWKLIEDPSGRRQICYQKGDDNLSSGQHARIKVSEAAKFVGGSPGVLRVPAAADEQVLWGTGTDASPNPVNLWSTSTARLHFVADPSAIGGVYGFWMFQTVIGGSSQVGGSFFCEPMAPGSYRAAEAAPCNWYANQTAFVGGQSTLGWFAYGLPNQAWSAAILANAGPYNGALGNNLVDNTHDNGYPTWSANVGGSVRIRGTGACLAWKGPALAYPATANSATASPPPDGKAYLGSLVWPYLNGVVPSVS